MKLKTKSRLRSQNSNSVHWLNHVKATTSRLASGLRMRERERENHSNQRELLLLPLNASQLKIQNLHVNKTWPILECKAAIWLRILLSFWH